MYVDIFWAALLLLLPTVVLLSGHELLVRPFGSPSPPGSGEKAAPGRDDDAADCCPRRFRRVFLQVYLLVMASEWLQGPYAYSLFRDEKGLPESTVAALYVTAYAAAAVSAPPAGWLADVYGRRSACLVFCGAHALSCLSVVVVAGADTSLGLAVLFAGRVFAGLALTLLWTAFESWMVTEFRARRMERARGVALGTMFGVMTTANCLAAILGGVAGHCLVTAAGSQTSPFLAGMALDMAAAVLMLLYWNENYGDRLATPASAAPSAPLLRRARDTVADVAAAADPRIWTLSFISCCFEGTSFLVMFYWPAAMLAAHEVYSPAEAGADSSVPYGVIFATFMCTMVLGAILFSHLCRAADLRSSRPTILLLLALVGAGACLVAAAFARGELALLAALLGFEFCNGVYVPSVAWHRGVMVGDGRRSGLYGAMRAPLFAFVVAALCTTGEGGERRRVAFVACAGLLCLAALAGICALLLAVGRRGRREGGGEMLADDEEWRMMGPDGDEGVAATSDVDSRAGCHGRSLLVPDSEEGGDPKDRRGRGGRRGRWQLSEDGEDGVDAKGEDSRGDGHESWLLCEDDMDPKRGGGGSGRGTYHVRSLLSPDCSLGAERAK